MKKLHKFPASIILGSAAIIAAAETCPQPAVEIEIKIYPDRLIRSNLNKELFGFNAPWPDFQMGYFRNGTVRPEVIEWLKPFKDAVYRYSLGTDWTAAVGQASKRPNILLDYGQKAKAEFGIDEFSEFVKKVDGKALFIINMNGEYKEGPGSGAIKENTLGLMKYIKDESRFRCVGGPGCRVLAWELGNEMDFPPSKWTAEKYSEQALEIVQAASPIYPEIKWIANGKTAPWDTRSIGYQKFNKKIAEKLANKVVGIAIHPYYDGISVPDAMSYVSKYASTWHEARTDAEVYVTEHARWPAMPKTGKWQDNWYMTTNIDGAISTADFMLAMLDEKSIRNANWHGLSANGPWQLFSWDRTSDVLRPTPLYWALRKMRESFLDDMIAVEYQQPERPAYYGGYDIRIVGMKSTDGKILSINGVNRSNSNLKTNIKIVGKPNGVGNEGWEIASVSGDSNAGENEIYSPPPKKNKEQIDQSKELCISARSVFSMTKHEVIK